MDCFEIGSRIRSYRKKSGLTMTDLANKLNLSQPYLSQIETGKQPIRIDVLIKMCKLFNVSLTKFFSNELPSDRLTEIIENLQKLDDKEIHYLNEFLSSLLNHKKKT